MADPIAEVVAISTRKKSAPPKFDLAAHAISTAELLDVRVFPVLVAPDPERPGKTKKTPLCEWRKHASSDPDGIRALFRKHRRATHAGICAGETARLLLVDFDGQEGLQYWRDHSELFPPTIRQKTRNGWHLYYRTPEGCVIKNSTSEVADRVDIKHDGGFILDWSSEFPREKVIDIEDAPPALIATIKAADPKGKAPPASDAATDSTADVIPDKKRNVVMASEVGKLYAAGLSKRRIEYLALEIDRNDCKPPMGRVEVLQIVKSVGETDARNKAKTAVTFGVVSRCMKDIEAEKLEWLVPKLMPLGKVGFIAGDPGKGKSTATLDLAASVTTTGRGPWKGSIQGEVIILSAEDDLGDTVRPRLDAAGADVTKIWTLEMVTEYTEDKGERKKLFNLARDVDRLREMLVAHPKVVLITIDPVSAYMSGVDTHRNSDVRAVLAPLVDLASEFGVTILGVDHLNKSAGSGKSAVYRMMGSLAFAAAGRFVLIVVEDDEDPERRLMLPGKENLGPEKFGYAYRIVEASNGVSKLEWEAEPVAINADDAVNAREKKPKRDPDVENWIMNALSEGPRRAAEMWRESEALEYSKRRVDAAKKALGVKYFHDPEPIGPVYWAMPGKTDFGKEIDA